MWLQRLLRSVRRPADVRQTGTGQALGAQAAWFTRTGLPGCQRPGAWFSKGSDSGRAQGEKRKALGFGGPVLNPAARKHSEAAAASLAPFGDSSGIGAKLLAQMGFGTAGSGLGRAGQVRRRRSRPLVSEERVVGCGRG